MPDILIRGLSEEAVEVLDKEAADLGISRNELLRRRLEQAVRPGERRLTIEDLRRSAELTADLADPEIMAAAWR